MLFVMQFLIICHPISCSLHLQLILFCFQFVATCGKLVSYWDSNCWNFVRKWIALVEKEHFLSKKLTFEEYYTLSVEFI